MILLIDNYDSFSYNVYQLIGSVEPDIRVIRNDDCTVEEIEHMQPEAIILSPGPGRPSQAGVCIEVIKKLGEKIPIIGICLGHQAICEACGATVSYAAELIHENRKKSARWAKALCLQDCRSALKPPDTIHWRSRKIPCRLACR